MSGGVWVPSALSLGNHVRKHRVVKDLEQAIDICSNTVWADDVPRWAAATFSTRANRHYVLLTLDHCYGDGAAALDIWRYIFTNQAKNNIKSRTLLTEGMLGRIYMLLRVIVFLLMRHRAIVLQPSPTAGAPSRAQAKLATLSLHKLRALRKVFCTGTTINDIAHAILAKANALYFRKDTISSAAIFNMRKADDVFSDRNKIGFMILINKCTGTRTDVVQDVRAFMKCYKSLPLVQLTYGVLEWCYAWKGQAAIDYMRRAGMSLDFVISNYPTGVKDKILYGRSPVRVKNIGATVLPGDVKQLYSIVSYEDNVNLHVSYQTEHITDVSRLRLCFSEAVTWIAHGGSLEATA
tara:strand:+ start:1768 stop:2820 length:1053 start_codon:yes stop_codon:yes gene_type:complete